MRLVCVKVTPKWVPCHVTSCPAPINPEVTPAMARSPLQFVEAMCKSTLRARSKQRSIGAAIDVSNTIRVIPSSGSHRRGKAQLPSCDTFLNSSVPRPSCAASRVWRALGRSRADSRHAQLLQLRYRRRPWPGENIYRMLQVNDEAPDRFRFANTGNKQAIRAGVTKCRQSLES